jgi:small subunit ribosomal protein S1
VFRPSVPARIENAKQNNRLITGRVLMEVKGGYTVEIEGFRAFCPYSEMYRFGKNEHEVKSKKSKKQKRNSNVMEFIVIEVSLRSVVVSSKRAAKIRGLDKARKSLASGEKIYGVVRNVMPYGAFIDLGGVDGLLHISEFGNGWIDDIKKFIKNGQAIHVYVKGIDEENIKISLSLKKERKLINTIIVQR